MIVSFRDPATEDLYRGRPSARIRRFPPDLLPAARRKMDMLAATRHLYDLRLPPGNRLEALKEDLSGFHAIRVNRQWRIVFRWTDGAAHDVALMDYH